MASEVTQATVVQWGCGVFHLNNAAFEMGLSEQQLRHSTGFIIGILSRS